MGGVFFDLGRPVIGGWMGGGWTTHDDVRGIDIIWGGEFGQEGSILFGADVDTGQIVERHWSIRKRKRGAGERETP